MNSKRYLTAFVMLGWGLALPATADVEAECRGVAAGVVAALRASGDVSGEAAVDAAVLGARRGCEAAMMSGGGSGGSAERGVAAAEAEDEGSFWNIFGDGDDDDGDPASDNPGIERLKRLRN